LRTLIANLKPDPIIYQLFNTKKTVLIS